ncbi:MAG: HDOD domain-containing protein [Sulfurimonas sp.]|nr:HDOD domain-containing protein [Sulfurimonas sp.]MDD5201653.1 HDOD domain-containing protein [Sulfurimonas sp.]
MITTEKLNSYITKIPPAPQALRDTLHLLNLGDLTKAAKIASDDLALNSYLKNLMHKSIYGFRNEVSDISQIFGILGVAGSQQAVYNYMISLLSPSKWVLFKLNATAFQNLQAELSVNWKKILAHLNINDKDIQSAITLLPASIIISEALFSEKIENVKLLRSASAIDLNTILKRLCGMDLFDICEKISQKWEMQGNIAKIVQAASGIKPQDDKNIDMLGKWMHLLLFYTLSKPSLVEAGLNDFIDFQVEYVMDIYDDFSSVIGVS